MTTRRKQPQDEDEFFTEKFIDMHGEHIDSEFKLMTPEKEVFATVHAFDRI